MADRVYVDHAATTPMLPAARAAWLDQAGSLGNASSLHTAGRAARRVVEESRESIADALGVRPSAVVFTGGGTEADNLAVKGLYWAHDRTRTRVLASSIEHHAVLDPVQWLERHERARVTWLRVDGLGRVDVDEIATWLTRADEVSLVTVMWANNEIGTIQPIAEIARLCRDAGVPFHTDAVQGLGHVPLDITGVGADAVTVSSHKVGGPFGVGALVVRPGLDLVPVLHGGGQEREVRSGTLDVPAIAGFAVAVDHAVRGQAARAVRLRGLSDELIAGIRAVDPTAIVNGDVSVDGRLPGNVHVSFPGCEGDLLLMLLDAAGVDCSTGSACTAGVPEPSHVLLALGVEPALARSSLRFTFGDTSTPADVDAVVAALPAVLDRARRAGVRA